MYYSIIIYKYSIVCSGNAYLKHNDETLQLVTVHHCCAQLLVTVKLGSTHKHSSYTSTCISSALSSSYPRSFDAHCLYVCVEEAGLCAQCPAVPVSHGGGLTLPEQAAKQWSAVKQQGSYPPLSASASSSLFYHHPSAVIKLSTVSLLLM